jgi:hypothetical protein
MRSASVRNVLVRRTFENLRQSPPLNAEPGPQYGGGDYVVNGVCLFQTLSTNVYIAALIVGQKRSPL